MFQPDFAELQADLERTLTRLKATKDPQQKRQLLLQMQALLAEADRLLLDKPECFKTAYYPPPKFIPAGNSRLPTPLLTKR
ncbi:MAG TPA: hypothetical protein VGS05_14940 [Candidatus Sulfotelmatobacter sp.]|nr:hypothetical protein [Candidatus Sulfotelmatobacter sp.]